MSLTGVRLQYRLSPNFLKPVPTPPMKLTSLLLAAGLAATTTLPSALRAAKASPPTHERSAETDPAAGTDPEQAKLSAAKRKVHELPDVASAQQQAKADRAMAAKAAAEYKHARTKAAESETAYRKAFDAALAKEDPEAASIQKKQRDAFREKILKARAEKKPAAGKPATAKEDGAEDGTPERGEG